MTKTIRFGAAGIAMFAAIGMGSAAHAQSATADATAEILDALTLTADNELDFGTMVVSGAGTVTLDESDASRSCSANIVCAGTGAAAGFTVEGTGGNVVDVSLPTASVNLVHVDNAGSTAAAHNIVLDGFTSTADTGTGAEVTLDAGTGEATFDVGGTITLDGSEIAGVYEGTFDVSVAYQ